MRSVLAIRQDLRRVLVRALFALFLLPAIAWGFTHYMLAERDESFLAAVDAKVRTDGGAPAEQQAVMAFYRAVPPSAICADSADAHAAYRAAMCEPLSEQWQFYWVNLVAKCAVGVGVLLLLTVALLGLVAFRSRAAQYASLVLGWRILAGSSAVEVIVQSAMAVWLSFWVPAYFFQRYSVKLIVLIGLCAGVAAVVAVARIFARTAGAMGIEGELVSEADAPELWGRVRALAAQLGTSAPEHLVAGIDANFFVSEVDIQVQGQLLHGRTLYVSLPLLQVLDQAEAEAVLVHELAHLRGGDTTSSAKIGPKLVQFDAYCEAMRGAGLTLVAYYLLSMYRFILELALKRDSREREFLADRAAAATVGGMPLVRSLIKVAAYSTYRGRVERELFARQSKHDESIGIAAFVAQGLPQFALSGEFLSEMETASVPHPFDSHPLLDERMRNVGVQLPPVQFGAVMTDPLASSWASQIMTGPAIEARLWSNYESRFAQSHEQDLAYRYLPDGDAERAIVEKYFPLQVFDLKKDQRLMVAFDCLTLPGDHGAYAWDDLSNIQYEEGYGGDVLKLTTTQKGVFGNKTVKVKLAGIKAQRQQLKAALGSYWHRHKYARGKA